MIPNLIIWSFLVSFPFIPAPVFTATFTTIRVPLSIAPIVGIPRPDFKDAEVARPENVELYAKATIYDDLSLSTIYDLARILASSMSSVISNVFVLEERGLLLIDDLSAYNCTTWCLDLQISEITRVTGKTMENLKGNPDTITVLELHNLIFQTLEDIYCFDMAVIEQRLNMSSKILLEHQWALFVPEIVKEAVQCRANTLGVTVSELAELLRMNLATLYGYTLEDLTNTFFPNFLLLQARKNLFETRSLDAAYGVAGLTQAQGAAETMLSFAGGSSINFNLRDLEILYDWQKPQLYAIENIPLSSYLSQCSVITSNSLLAVSTVLFGQGATEPTCNVAYVLSRSLNEVEAQFNALTAVEIRNSLFIFMTTTSISNWFVMDDILQLDIDEGIWVEIPSVSHVASAASQTTTFIRTCSLPQVIASLKNSNVTGTLGPFLAINNPTFRNLLLTTYGYSYNELISLTQTPLSQLSNLPVVELHAIILEALADRYSIPNLPPLLGVPGVVDMHILSTLPSFEWSRIVIAVIQASFAHAADALSVNLAAGSHIAVVDQADGNPSIQVNPSPIYFSPRVTTSALATCLLGRNEADIYAMSLPEYHTLFSVNIIPIVEGKITIETTPLENLLATNNLVLRQVWNRTVADVVAQYTGLTVPQLGCLYGWDQVFLNFINTTTWGDVSAFRLCSEYEKLTLHRILVQLSTAPAVNCFGTISLSSSTYDVRESDGIVVIFVQLLGQVDDVIQVSLSVTPVSATGGTDFQQIPDTTVTFQAGETGQKPVPINILDDQIVENNEQFLVFITSSDSDTRVVISTATVTILDDDFVSLSWQVADNSVAENVGLVTANLVLNGDIEKNIAVSIGANDLTTSAADYSLLTTVVTFTPSDVSNTKAIQLFINNDLIVEGPESLQLTPSTTDASVNTTSTVILILDDDKITVSFVEAAYSFSEGILNHQIEVIAVAQQLTTSVQVSLANLNDGAFSGQDYSNTNSLLTFTPFSGSQTLSFTVQILPDSLVEYDETFEVQLSVPLSTTLAQLGNPSKTVVTILDDDKAVINFQSPSYVVLETANRVDVSVTISGDLRRPVDVGYATLTGTASTADYTAAAGTITFNPGGSAIETLQITITNDNFVEASEQFRVSLQLRDAANTEIGSTGETTVTITDNDKAQVEHVDATYSFPENVGIAVLGVRLVNLAGPLQTNVNVSVAVVGTTAQVISDFTQPSSVLTFLVGDSNNNVRNILIPINDDSLFEIDEQLLVVLSPGSDDNVEVQAPAQATVTITNNDVAQISFTSSSYSVTEGQLAAVMVQVTAGTLGSSVTVSVNAQVGTAGNTDFTSTITSVPFAAGETGPKTVNFITFDDDIVEASELFTVSLSSTSGILLGPQASVLINDNDDVVVQFTSIASAAIEGSGDTSVQLSAVGERAIPVTVSVSTQADSATGNVDYITKTESVTFQPSEVLRTVDFTILDDQGIEEGESFKVVLNAVSSQVTLGSINEHTINIIDDDFATVQFTSAVFSGNETFGSVDIWVILTGVLEDPTSVSVSTQQDTAVAGVDYTSVTSSVLTFTPGGATLQNIAVNIVDDTLIEGTERFTASLSTGNSFTRIGSINETTVRIIDNDVASLGFSNVLDYEVNEGSVALLTVQLTGPLTTQVSATASVVLESASNGDFNVLSSTDLNFSPGNTQASIAINTIDDSFIESNEVFRVILSTTSPSVQINDGITTVTILDNDNALISLGQNSYQGSENSPVVEVSINVIGTLETVVQARLVLLPLTAISSDYADLDDPIVTFSPGSPTTQRRNITIVDDGVVENLEFMNVRLDAVSNNVQITPTSSASISITDNDAAIFGFQPTTYVVQESSQFANLSVVLFSSAPLGRNVIFRYSTINNTAKSPGDYDEIADGQLQFNIGDGNGAVRLIPIGINDDDIIEQLETFQVQLTAITSDTISSNTASVNINDNDVPSIRLIETAQVVTENDAQVSVRAILLGNIDREVTARLTSSDVTATANLDYQPINQEITFTVANPLQEVFITINEDTFVEGTETFRVTLTSTDADVIDPTLTVTITDDDFVGIAFQNVAQDVPETQSSVLIPIVLTGNRAVPITFAIDTVSVSATQGTDYVWSRQSVTINPNDPSTYVASIPITNDNIVEGDELFRVLIDASNALVTNNGAFLTVTIKDDDTANVRFSQSTYTFEENVIVGTVTIEIDRNLETTASVTVSSTTNTATSGVDFVAIVSQPVIFTSGDTSKQLTVRILDDNIVEADEVLSLSLTTGAGSPLAVGTPGTALITINDDDVASVEMDSISYTYSENDATAVVEAKLNALAPIARPLSFRIFTENGTAYSPRDFTHLDQIGGFNPGVGNGAKVSFSIVISDDVVVENTESFFVQLAEINSALQIVNPNRSTVFIQDNDAFEAQFTHGDLTVNEEAGSVQISVRLNGQHEREVTIRLTTTQITATAGADYESQVVDLQFSPGDSLEALDILILDDLVIEGTETFRVTISSNDAQVRIVDPPSITVTIIDTDVATVSFNQTEYRVSEDVGSSALWVELKNDLQLNAEVNVQVYNFPDTAKSPEDYTFANTLTILTFRGGQTKLLPIYYNVIDDNNVENEESFYGLINADGVTVRAEEPLLVKAYIEDNDVAIVGFTQALYTVNENADAVVEVQLQNTLAVSVTVSIKTTTGTAGSNDFGGITRRDLTFDPGETTIPVTIQIVHDVNVENNENFIVSLETTHPRVQFSRNTATVRIDDDDRVSIAFQLPRYIVNEDDGSVQISYPIVGSTEVPLNYVVHIDQGSARLGSDYLGISLPLTISPGTTQNTVTVQLVNDENIESNETFSLRMDNLNDARIILVNPSTTTVEILDDDAATVEFAQPQYSVSESGVSVTATLNLTGILDQATTVSVSSHDVTAIAGLDYTAISNQEITFTPNGPTEQDIVVQISNDALLEGTESFLLAVSSQNVNTRIGDNANTTVRILDNDVVSVDFVLTSANVLEQVSAALVEIEIQGARTLPVTVRVQSINLNAESGSDYTAVDTEVTFQTFESTKSVSVPIINDNLIEIDEQFLLRLSTDDNNVIINDNEMRITIIDNDVAAIRFEQSSYTVNEANDNVTLHILLTGNLGIPVSAEVQLDAQTADDGTDFIVPLTRTVTFSPGSNRADITINIIDDDIIEATETFFADLAGIGSKVILGSPQRTTVFIQDNDNALVRFLLPTRNVNEDAGFLNMTIELITVNPLQRDVSISYSTEEGTAESPEDFSNVVGSTVIFRAGDSNGARQYGIVPIIDDQIVEAPESFIIRLISVDSGLIPTTFSSTTISIIDNDRATLAFAQPAYSVNEPDTPVQLLVLLTGTITRTVTARVSTLNIDAVGGSDYSSIGNRQITFSPGDPTFQSVDITINDDAIVENNERFTATLTAENGVNIRPDGATTTVTIVDNDVVTVSLQASQIDVTEASTNAIVLVTVTGAREREISVNVSTYDVSAFAVLNDYDAKTEIVTLQPSSVQAPFLVGIREDNIVENTEQFGVRVTSTDPQVNVVNGNLQVSITDNDKITLTMDSSTYQVEEDDGFVSVRVVVTGQTAVDIAGSRLSTNPLSAQSPSDYGAIDRTILVTPSSSTPLTFTIIIQNDATIESNELFQAVLSTTNTDQVNIGTPSSSSITILDDDALFISFEQPNYIVSEDDGTISVGVTVTGSTALTLEFGVTATDGSATAPADYVLLDSTVQLTPGVSRHEIRVRLINDLNLEHNETFTLNLNNRGDTRVRVLGVGQTTILIVDDDAATIQFVQDLYSVNENDNSVLVSLSIVGALEDPAVVRVSSRDNSAFAGIDYDRVTNYEVTFVNGGATIQSFTVNITDDSLLEGTESFFLDVSSSVSNIRIGDRASTMIRIIDEDSVSVEFVKTVDSIQESNAVLRVDVEILGQRSVPVVVTVESNNLLAIAGEDYNAVDETITFQPSETQKSLFVTVREDTRVEADETFVLLLSTDTDGVTLGDRTMTITITDDDFATVRLERSTYTVNESVTSFTIGVILGGDRSIAIDANVAFTPDTAVVGDYLVGNGDVTFNPGDTQKQITVFITNDNIVEPLEHFRATLTAGSKAIVVTPSQAQIFIQDDDVAQIRFQSTAYSVNEADRIVNLTVVLLTSQPLGRAATFSFSTQDGTAVSTNNVDYDRVSGSLAIFNAGDTNGATKQISVSIIDDSRTEATESFTVTLSAVNGGGLVPTTSSTATVNIIDNDNAIIRFSPDSYTVLESQGSVSLSVVRIGVIERPVSVFVALQAGTATLTDDFTNVGATVTFNVVDSSIKSVPISITNDIIIEETESFTASLTAVTGAVVPNDGDTATITILDDDILTIVMEAVPSVVDEDDGVVTVVVRAVGGLQRTISLNVFTFDLTASNGDYVSKTEVITLDSTNTARNFVVTILNDNTVENTETFGVNITTDESQVRIQDETVVITILDEDKLTLSISEASYTAQENAGVATVGVTITGTTDVIVSGSVLSTRDGSAVNPDDYLPATQNLVIVPGENSKSMIIIIVNDQLTEGSENIILELTTTNNGQIDIGRSAAVVLIQDDDVATVQFLSNQYYVNETDNSVRIAVILTGSVAQSTVVRVDTAQDSALAALDYVQIVDSRLTFTSGGAVIQYVDITIRDDSFIEGSEDFTATLTLLSPLATLGPVSTTRITILDNDVAGIGFALSQVTVPENGGPVQIAVDSTANLNTPVTVSITVTGITASPSDYTVADDITLTFTATGPSRQFFSFTPINDARIENDELVTATLSTTDPQAVILTSQIQITIEDDDRAVVRLDRSTISTDEGDGFVNIRVLLTGTLDISVTVNLAANGLTATENNDFTFNDQAVVFQPGNTQVTRQVIINNDNAVEAAEFFNVVLTSTDGNVEIGDPDTTIVTINDNDDASLFFQSATYTGLENNEEVTLTVVLATTVPLQRQVIASFTLTSGTAVSPEDFPPTTTATVTFNAGVGNLATRDVVIAIEDDNIVEPAQTFQVTIVSGANVINPGTATVTILDNDVVSVRFLQDVYRFAEDATDTNVNVVILSSSPLQKSVTIGIASEDNSAIANLDYTPLFANNVISISPSDGVQKSVPVNIINDGLFESEENFRLRLSTSDASVTVTTPNLANVFIIDEDDAVVSFQQDVYWTTEDSGSVQICVVASIVLADNIVVTVSTGIDTALPTLDFQPIVNQQLTLTSTIPVCFNVTILQDITVEGNETFSVVLATLNPRVQIPDRTSLVVIVDDDVNECIDLTHDCHPTRAICSDTEDSFTCTCLPGYTGDGRVCPDIDECALNTHTCHENATCVNNIGSYECVCNQGYTGDGRNCADIFDCNPEPNSYPCHRFSLCLDTLGSYICWCPAGFVGDGYNFCNDTNECLLGTHNCASVAACQNIRGSFICQCPVGYFGDGTQCVDNDECDLGTDLCDDDARCDNTVGSYDCTCNLGYSGNGRVCDNINECLTNPCDANANCVDSDGSFQCICNSGFSGNGFTCTDIDECANNPCAANATCSNTPGTYDCVCNTGFSGDGHNFCNDDNECTLGTDNCHVNATCNNNPGSFSCMCLPGFVGNGVSCQNDNECARTVCHQYATCIDTIGSFRCECNAGFMGDGMISCQDVINCIPTSFDWPCHQRANCVDEPVGSFTCTCRAGYTGDGFTCDDLNECTLGLHNCNATNSECVNTQGSFRCQCKDGYILIDDTCQDFNECNGTNPCNVSTSNCVNREGTHSCICKSGFTQDSSDQDCYDINECNNPDDNNCHANANCMNTFGSFDCVCKPGFSGDGIDCLDINECRLNPCHLNADCNNNEGSYTCTCKTGYTGDGVNSCTDINECPGACLPVLATCTNMPGSFSCQCIQGYQGDGETACNDINECDDPNTCIGGTCTNTIGNFTCTCGEGYNKQGNTCIDINECVEQPNICPANSNCNNFPGLYNCVCHPGYGGAACIDMNECLENTDNCHDNATCSNNEGSFACQCIQGYTGDGTNCADINECTDGTDNCGNNAQCVNEPQTFSCRCNQGFSGNGIVCQDIDECDEQPEVCHINATCSNSEGSYSCQCKSGFTGDGKMCTDIMECGANNPCHVNATCAEELGSFKCDCNPGFSGDGMNCANINECLQPGICHADADCQDFIGTHRCTCKSGFAGDGITCTDINECQGNTDNCHDNATCSNDEGSFDCQCIQGYTGDGTNCEDINECTDGTDNCGNNAQCVNEPQTFSCHCNQGFSGNGIVCQDINECAEQPELCHVNATCSNSEGSYSCQCKSGFTGDGKMCTDITECGGSNPCHVNATCTEEVGGFRCDCNPGFSGDGMNCANINECLQPGICHADADCQDFIGTHRCTCKSGFAGDGITCTDIDECGTNTNNNCHAAATCTNVPGTYSCACNTGYSGDGVICNDIDECASGSHNCHVNADCANDAGTYTCTCKNGFTGNGRACVDINECDENPNNLCPSNTICENTYASYRCNCPRGQNFIDQVCTDVLVFNLQFTIQNVSFTNDLNDPRDEDYLKLKSQLESSVDNVYNKSDERSFYIAPARLQWFSQGPSNTVTANFSIFFNPAVREMSMDDVEREFTSNLATANGQSVLEPRYELTSGSIAAGDYNECSYSPSVCDDDELCQNYPGTYRCYCSSPRAVNINNVCTNVITYEAGFLILDIPFVPELSDPNSLLFLQLAEDIQFQLNRHYMMAYPNTFQGTQIVSMESGSVIIRYLVFFKPNTDVTANGNSLSKNLENTLNRTNNGVFLGPYSIDTSRFTQDDYNECNPSNLVHIQDCHEKANCTNVLSTYTCVCKEGYYGNGTICTAIPITQEPNPTKDDLWWLVYAIAFGIAFLVIAMIILFLCCLENAEENKYMVENTTLVSDRNRYFFNNESVGIVNPDIEMSPTGNGAREHAVYTTSPAHSRMESYKVNPMFHETKSHTEQSSMGGKSSISNGQEGYVTL